MIHVLEMIYIRHEFGIEEIIIRTCFPNTTTWVPKKLKVLNYPKMIQDVDYPR